MSIKLFVNGSQAFKWQFEEEFAKLCRQMQPRLAQNARIEITDPVDQLIERLRRDLRDFEFRPVHHGEYVVTNSPITNDRVMEVIRRAARRLSADIQIRSGNVYLVQRRSPDPDPPFERRTPANGAPDPTDGTFSIRTNFDRVDPNLVYVGHIRGQWSDHIVTNATPLRGNNYLRHGRSNMEAPLGEFFPYNVFCGVIKKIGNWKTQRNVKLRWICFGDPDDRDSENWRWLKVTLTDWVALARAHEVHVVTPSWNPLRKGDYIRMFGHMGDSMWMHEWLTLSFLRINEFSNQKTLTRITHGRQGVAYAKVSDFNPLRY